MRKQPAAARYWILPLSRFPLRGQAGGTAASAALRLGHCAGPRQNASRVLGRKGRGLRMDGAPPRTPYEQLAQHETLQYKPDRSLANKTGQIEKLTTGPSKF